VAAPDRKKMLVFVAIFLISMGAWRLSAIIPEPQSPPVGHVEVKTTLDYINADAYIHVQIINRENVSICIDPHDYDSMFVRIPLYQQGKEAPFIAIAEPALHVKSSAKAYADVSIPYSIMMPNDSFYGQYALRNFKLKKGLVKIKLRLNYILCNDLVDAQRERRKQEPIYYPISHDADFIIK
jgi:hypothetical protein